MVRLGKFNQLKKVNSKILSLCYVEFKISEKYKIEVSNGFKFVIVKLKIVTFWGCCVDTKYNNNSFLDIKQKQN